jgi:hypothetical protein
MEHEAEGKGRGVIEWIVRRCAPENSKSETI